MGSQEKLAEKHWYIVTTYSQHENKAASNLRKRVENMHLEDYIFQVLVAEEEVEVQVMKNGKPAGTKKKMKNLFPGNIFVEMIMNDETWYVVRNTPDVTGIAGSAGGGQKPTPVSLEEMEPVLKRMGQIDETMISQYNVGDTVKVIRGTLEGTEGTIVDINKETGACRIEIVFFGRSTFADVEFSEIEKV